MSRGVRASALLAALLLLAGLPARAQTDFLTDAEADRLRDAQDPSLRMGVYLDLEEARLERLSSAEAGPAAIQRQLSQYVALNEELKSWIENQYDHQGDMRKGLRGLLERGPHQLEQLRALEKRPGASTADYAGTLHDAIANLNDTLDGSAKALSSQEKLFGRLKEERKADERATKERIKEEKKREKEERKLRKKMERQKPPEDP
jgi:hypothetical protein